MKEGGRGTGERERVVYRVLRADTSAIRTTSERRVAKVIVIVV